MAGLNITDDKSAIKVFEFFEEISKVPRGSSNTKKIADYLVDFARSRALEFYRDEYDNVIIKKEATEGYEARPTVILQGHTDIVADKIKSSKKNLEKEGLELYRDGDFIRAKETTLGADDGIAMAYALALLNSSDIPHPKIEALFTSDEEIGLIGASALDTSNLDGKIMINVDSDEEGVFTVGCAGGLRMDLEFNAERKLTDGNLYKLSISGLMGGHSGVEINKGRLNAIKELGKILLSLKSVKIVEIEGGNADNAIPRDAYAIFGSDIDYSSIKSLTELSERNLQINDKNAKITLEKYEDRALAFDCENSAEILSALDSLPSGVCAMEEKIPDMVETSMNVGIIKTFDTGVTISASLRSSRAAAKADLKARVRAIGERLGASVSERGEYPEWEFKSQSRLCDIMKEVYTEMHGSEPSVIIIHAGLECGIFSNKIPGLDCVSIGPDNFDIHTPDEHLSISSSIRVWHFLKEVLKRI